ncbi:MAG: signal recognition particle-docking protein FtsY, partial [Treponema sp.]|nr:signal recognition particle-docking protein FtsY [Treponema sp.]
KSLSEEVFDDLTDLLVEGDFGASVAYKLADRLREQCKKEKINDGEGAKKILAGLLEEMLNKGGHADGTADGAADASILRGDDLLVILLLGVNGVGKTTTAAKLAKMGMDCGRHPILAAGDTFRAAAIDQLKVHGERLGTRVVAHQHGGDPAAVIYDALEAARSGAGNLIIADTAGRMHTKASLVEELKKIDRVVESRASGCRYLKYLVLDATTGRNAVAQAEIFHQAVAIDGVILAKFDSTARGGAVFSLAEEFGLPVIFICTGEKYGDIKPFNPHIYAQEFAGLA